MFTNHLHNTQNPIHSINYHQQHVKYREFNNYDSPIKATFRKQIQLSQFRKKNNGISKISNHNNSNYNNNKYNNNYNHTNVLTFHNINKFISPIKINNNRLQSSSYNYNKNNNSNNNNNNEKQYYRKYKKQYNQDNNNKITFKQLGNQYQYQYQQQNNKIIKTKSSHNKHIRSPKIFTQLLNNIEIHKLSSNIKSNVKNNVNININSNDMNQNMNDITQDNKYKYKQMKKLHTQVDVRPFDCEDNKQIKNNINKNNNNININNIVNMTNIFNINNNEDIISFNQFQLFNNNNLNINSNVINNNNNKDNKDNNIFTSIQLNPQILKHSNDININNNNSIAQQKSLQYDTLRDLLNIIHINNNNNSNNNKINNNNNNNNNNSDQFKQISVVQKYKQKQENKCKEYKGKYKQNNINYVDRKYQANKSICSSMSVSMSIQQSRQIQKQSMQCSLNMNPFEQ